MSAVLITGNPGSGKTRLAAELARRGHPVIDADDIAAWETAAGEPATQPVPTPDDWWAGHRWVWSRRRVEAVVENRSRGARSLFVCGIAVNQRDMLDLFDLVFLLAIDHRTQVARLDEPSNAHRTAAARTQILRGRPVFEAEMRVAGAIILDGRRPTPALADRILRDVESSSAEPPRRP